MTDAPSPATPPAAMGPHDREVLADALHQAGLAPAGALGGMDREAFDARWARLWAELQSVEIKTAIRQTAMKLAATGGTRREGLAVIRSRAQKLREALADVAIQDRLALTPDDLGGFTIEAVRDVLASIERRAKRAAADLERDPQQSLGSPSDTLQAALEDLGRRYLGLSPGSRALLQFGNAMRAHWGLPPKSEDAAKAARKRTRMRERPGLG